jgi:hypothetical protein
VGDLSAAARRVMVAMALAGAFVGTACQHGLGGVASRTYLDRSASADGSYSPAQLVYLRGFEVVVDAGAGRLLYRRAGSLEPFATTPVELNEPHAVALGGDGSFYVVDTGNDRVVRCEDLERGECTSAGAIAGQPLSRPHDIVLEPESGLLYVIDGDRRLYRFRSFGVDEAVLQFRPREVGYARALSVVKGRVYVVGSNLGQVLRVDNFERRRFRTFTAPGKRKRAAWGSWESTGLVLNDVERFAGYWYGSNYFSAYAAAEGDGNRFRLIRWRSWSDFEHGRWEDLAHLLDRGVVPYFFTVVGDRLYVACLQGVVYELMPVAETRSAAAAAPR